MLVSDGLQMFVLVHHIFLNITSGYLIRVAVLTLIVPQAIICSDSDFAQLLMQSSKVCIVLGLSRREKALRVKTSELQSFLKQDQRLKGGVDIRDCEAFLAVIFCKNTQTFRTRLPSCQTPCF